MWRAIGRFRYIAWVKCPYRVAGNAFALARESGRQVASSYRVAGKAPALGVGSEYTETGLLS